MPGVFLNRSPLHILRQSLSTCPELTSSSSLASQLVHGGRKDPLCLPFQYWDYCGLSRLTLVFMHLLGASPHPQRECTITVFNNCVKRCRLPRQVEELRVRKGDGRKEGKEGERNTHTHRENLEFTDV